MVAELHLTVLLPAARRTAQRPHTVAAVHHHMVQAAPRTAEVVAAHQRTAAAGHPRHRTAEVVAARPRPTEAAECNHMVQAVHHMDQVPAEVAAAPPMAAPTAARRHPMEADQAGTRTVRPETMAPAHHTEVRLEAPQADTKLLAISIV